MCIHRFTHTYTVFLYLHIYICKYEKWRNVGALLGAYASDYENPSIDDADSNSVKRSMGLTTWRRLDDERGCEGLTAPV